MNTEPSSPWKLLLKPALLGLGRAAQFDSIYPEITKLLSMNSADGKFKVDSIDQEKTREEVFLELIACTQLYHRAGQSYPSLGKEKKTIRQNDSTRGLKTSFLKPNSHSDSTSILPCPLEELAPIQGLTRDMIQNLSSESYLFSWWIEQMQLNHLRIPHQWIVHLLELGVRKTELQMHIKQVIGQRGHWLAKQNSRWSYAEETDSKKQTHQQNFTKSYDSFQNEWDLAHDHQRLQMLKTLLNTQQSFAKELLKKEFKAEHAKVRVKWLQVLQEHLDHADESFLENCLDDRSTEVKKQASLLLNMLPNSDFVQRNIKRIQTYIIFDGEQLVVTLPSTTLDESEKRDQLGKIQLKKGGKRASRLYELMTISPLMIWQPHVNQESSDEVLHLLSLARQTDYYHLLLKGWVAACIQQKNRTWAPILVKQYLDDTTQEIPQSLWRLCAPTFLSQEGINLMGKNDLTWVKPISQICESWPDWFSQKVIDQITIHLEKKLKKSPEDLLKVVSAVGLFASLECHQKIDQQWRAYEDQLETNIAFAMDQCVKRFRLRKKLRNILYHSQTKSVPSLSTQNE